MTLACLLPRPRLRQSRSSGRQSLEKVSTKTPTILPRTRSRARSGPRRRPECLLMVATGYVFHCLPKITVIFIYYRISGALGIGSKFSAILSSSLTTGRPSTSKTALGRTSLMHTVSSIPTPRPIYRLESAHPTPTALSSSRKCGPESVDPSRRKRTKP